MNPPAQFRSGSFPWFFALAAIWILFVFIQFFIQLPNFWPSVPLFFQRHPWTETELLKRFEIWQGVLSSIFIGFWSAGLAWCYGRRSRQWLGLSIRGASLNFCLELGLGVFLFNALWMGLGLVRLWFESLWLTSLLLLSIPLLFDILKIRVKVPDVSRKGKLHSAAMGAVILYGVFLLFHSVLPETFYDSLNYFLGMPHFWIFQHGITDYPTQLLSGYFHGGSLFFMTAYVLGGAAGAKVLSAVVWGLCGLLAYGWVKEMAGSLAGTLAATAVLTFPLLYINAWAVRVDGILTLTLLLFFYSLDQAGQKKGRKGFYTWVFVSALFAGLALSIKPTAIVGIAAALIVILWQRGSRLLLDKKIWLIYGGLGLIEVGPWLLKNDAFTGNAFFPYAMFAMGGRQFSLQSYDRLLHENQQFLPMTQGFRSLLDLPWRLTMPQAGDGQMIGPILLAFLPILFFTRIKNASLRFLTGTMVLTFGLGLTLSHMLRFSIPAFVLAFMVLSAVIVSQKGWAWKGLWAGSVLASAILFLATYVDLSARFYDGGGIWMGKETSQAYLNRKLQNSYEPLVDWTNQNLPKDARLLLVGDSRSVYYDRVHYANSAFDDQFFALAARQERNAAGILKRLHKMGITHLVINGHEGLRVSVDYHQYELTSLEWHRLNEFVRLGLKPLYWRNFQAVYEVKSRLSDEKIPYLVNLFSFFAPSAYDFFQAVDGDTINAQAALRAQQAFFPSEKFFGEKAMRGIPEK